MEKQIAIFKGIRPEDTDKTFTMSLKGLVSYLNGCKDTLIWFQDRTCDKDEMDEIDQARAILMDRMLFDMERLARLYNLYTDNTNSYCI